MGFSQKQLVALLQEASRPDCQHDRLGEVVEEISGNMPYDCAKWIGRVLMETAITRPDALVWMFPFLAINCENDQKKFDIDWSLLPTNIE